MRELRDVPRDFEDDLETSVVILTGSAKAFSAGFDLKDPESRSREDLPIGERIQRQRLGPKICKAWQDMDQVTIAAVEAIASAEVPRWSWRSTSASAGRARTSAFPRSSSA